jgi:hypothetical protein
VVAAPLVQHNKNDKKIKFKEWPNTTVSKAVCDLISFKDKTFDTGDQVMLFNKIHQKECE